MSDGPASPQYVLSGSHRHCTAGDAIPRRLLLDMPQLTGTFRSSHAALVLPTKLINPLDNCDRGTTGSQVLTDTACATDKSP
jgi:hypothetical protein